MFASGFREGDRGLAPNHKNEKIVLLQGRGWNQILLMNVASIFWGVVLFLI